MEERRIGVIGIILERPGEAQAALNACISEASEIVIGRMGIPYRERGVAAIALLVDGSADRINALTGKLGALPGANVRSALTKR